jgi:hypothetical protein
VNLTAQQLFWWSLVGGLGAVGLTTIVRNAPVVRDWVQEAKKPWACNDCMPLYTVAAILAIPIYQTGNWDYALAYLPGYAVANITLKQMSKPPGPPRIPPEMLS